MIRSMIYMIVKLIKWPKIVTDYISTYACLILHSSIQMFVCSKNELSFLPIQQLISSTSKLGIIFALTNSG
jgi:hypothetical protein